MARIPGKRAQSHLGLAYEKDPPQRIAAIAVGFRQVLSLVNSALHPIGFGRGQISIQRHRYPKAQPLAQGEIGWCGSQHAAKRSSQMRGIGEARIMSRPGDADAAH